MTTSGAAAADVARELLMRVDAHDLDAVGELQHDDVVDDFVAVGSFSGKAAVRAFFEELFAAFPDFRLTVERVTGDDQHATAQWRATGTFTGAPFQGVHATGRPVELQGVDVMHIVDGRLKHNTIYYDGLSFARQVGLLPAAAGMGDQLLTTAFNLRTDVLAKVQDLLKQQR